MEHKPTQWRAQTYQMKIVMNKAQTYQMKKVTNRAQTYQIKIAQAYPMESIDLPNENRNESGTDLPNENRKERGTDLPNEDGTVLNPPNLTASARGGYGQRSLLPYRFFYFHMY